MKKRVTMYWLIPSKPESELFRGLIRILAKQFDAPVFMAHLTVGRAGDAMSSGKVLPELRAAPIRLRIREIAHSDKFTKTLFVRFERSNQLAGLVSQLGAKPKSLSDPHLSLLYKKLPVAVRRELADAINLPFRSITFDSIIAMSCLSPTETRRDVESWRKVATRPLSG